MIATTKNLRQKRNSLRWNDSFLKLLPTIQQQAEFAFRRMPLEPREELVQETIAVAYDLFLRLCRKGKWDLVYATPLTKFAVRHVRAGRRIGTRRNSLDITSRSNSDQKVVIERLDRFDQRRGEWREMLVEDRIAGPADTAAARIDWSAWLNSLSRRRRRIACTLASGESTGVAAREFRMSAARISQLRARFRESWDAFQGEAPTRPAVRSLR